MTLRPRFVETIENQKWDNTDLNAIVSFIRGFTTSGVFTSTFMTLIVSDETDYYAVRDAQIVYGGPDDIGGVDGGDLVAVVQAALNDAGTVILYGENNTWNIPALTTGVSDGTFTFVDNTRIILIDLVLQPADNLISQDAARTDFNFFYGYQKSNISIIMENSWIQGNMANQDPDIGHYPTVFDMDFMIAFKLEECSYVDARHLRVRDFGEDQCNGDVIYFHNCDHVYTEDCYGKNIGEAVVAYDGTTFGQSVNTRAQDWSQCDRQAAIVAVYSRQQEVSNVDVSGVTGKQTLETAVGFGLGIELDSLENYDIHDITCRGINVEGVHHLFHIASVPTGGGVYGDAYNLSVTNVSGSIATNVAPPVGMEKSYLFHAPYCNAASHVYNVTIDDVNAVDNAGEAEDFGAIYAKNAWNCSVTNIKVKDAKYYGAYALDCINCNFDMDFYNPDGHGFVGEDIVDCTVSAGAISGGTGTLLSPLIVFGASTGNNITLKRCSGYTAPPLIVHPVNNVITNLRQVKSPMMTLSDAAQQYTIYYSQCKVLIFRVAYVYDVATSADAGVHVFVGNYSNTDAYTVDTSDTSASAGDVAGYGQDGDAAPFNVTMSGYTATGTLVAAGTPIIAGTDGSKVGAGAVTVLVDLLELPEE